MNWRSGFFRVWVCLSVVWVALIAFVFANEFSLTSIQGGTFQYVQPTKKMPWETNWNASYYETHFAPGKGRHPDSFAVLESQYVQDWDKSVTEGRTVSVDMPDLSRLYMPSGLNKEDQDLVANMYWNQRWSRYLGQLAKPVGILVGPPLLVLLLGFGVWWIGRGFAKPKEVQNG